MTVFYLYFRMANVIFPVHNWAPQLE